jgi:hypothetical protein
VLVNSETGKNYINIAVSNQLRFLDIILKVLRLEVSVQNVYIRNQFQPTFSQTTFSQEEGGVKSVSRGDCEYSKKEYS